MEDFLILFAAFAIVIFAVYKIAVMVRNHSVKKAIEQAAKQRAADEYWANERKKMKQRAQANTLSKTPSVSVPPRGKETTVKYTPSYAPSPTQSVRDSNKDDGIDMLTSMMIFDAITNHHQQPSTSSSSSDTYERKESSWSSSSVSSSDDGPSYRDSSPSSSWGSSSSDSSSSWSSSSDSGPSSDW